MAAKAKIAISLAPEVLRLVDRHAAGRSRSLTIEQELMRALRAREWELLSAQFEAEDPEQEVAWAESAFAAADAVLRREESPQRRKRARPKPKR